jgi:hypothetical protein
MHPLLFALYDDGVSRFSEMPETVLICVLSQYLCVSGPLNVTPYAGCIDPSLEMLTASRQSRIDVNPDAHVEFIMLNEEGELVCKGPAPSSGSVTAHNPQQRHDDTVQQAAQAGKLWPPIGRFRYIPTRQTYYPLTARTADSISFYNVATDQYYRLWFGPRILVRITAQDLRALNNGVSKVNIVQDLKVYADNAVCLYKPHSEQASFVVAPRAAMACCVDGRGAVVLAYMEVSDAYMPRMVVVVLHQHRAPQLLYSTEEHVCAARLGITDWGDVLLWTRRCGYKAARHFEVSSVWMFKIGERLKKRRPLK